MQVGGVKEPDSDLFRFLLLLIASIPLSVPVNGVMKLPKAKETISSFLFSQFHVQSKRKENALDIAGIAEFAGWVVLHFFLSKGI